MSASTSKRAGPGPRVGIGTSYEALDPTFIEALLPRLDFVEVIPDTLAVREGRRSKIPAQTLRQLEQIATQATVIVHGVGLSIGMTRTSSRGRCSLAPTGSSTRTLSSTSSCPRSGAPGRTRW